MSQPRTKVDTKLPSFAGATEWLNRTAAGLPEAKTLKGHPTLVHFWSVSSEDSKTNLAQLAHLRDQRKRDGLRVIAIHSPQSEAEKDARVVRDAATRLNLTEPCALDNDHRLLEKFSHEPEDLPAYYLFDTEGNLLNSATGAAGLDTIEDQLDATIAEVRAQFPYCPECEVFLDPDAMFCAGCGLPLILPGSGKSHPYYENTFQGSLPTVRLYDLDPLIGHTIEGKYELVSKLGEGGMSVVYRARRAHIGDDVAVKILLRKFVKDDAALARFRHEARAAAMLRHQNVITIHDFGETNDDHTPAYIVMEFVRGTPLRELLKNEGHFSVERGLRLMRGICAGVGAAHRQGVIHRDLKPDNILVAAPDDDFEFESVRVVDFGLAKLLVDAGAGSAGAVVGTPFYMSPEQGMGEPLDTRSDVYSLGAMFYEMLSGKRPFEAETVSGVINRHLYEPPPPFSPSLAIPRRVSTAIMQALAKDPDARPQTAGDLARLLF
ncbi:MAG TPA: protein kinase [Pyrinomonadaceae bacterium]|jgi:tRNA A-37 threonylcarbamoyl transferase component Bud32